MESDLYSNLTVECLRKLIKEQKILLESFDEPDLDTIKKCITSIELQIVPQGRYQSNQRQLRTLIDQQQSLMNEIRYLAGTSQPLLESNSDWSVELEQLLDEAQSLQMTYDDFNNEDERDLFEYGINVHPALAEFIDQLKYPHRSAPVLAPPIPTSQRPSTPRSESDIKAEAFRRIQARKALLAQPTPRKLIQTTEKATVSEEVKAAQERMKQAEINARAHLDNMREKRNKVRQEAAKAEEKRRQLAAEATAAAEREMALEKERKQKEEEAKALKYKQAQEEKAERERLKREIEMERVRKEKEEQDRLETEEQIQKEKEERLAQETRQKKARQAAEEAAREKRLRRIELEKHEKEIEEAKQKEMDRRKQWQETERKRRQEEEEQIRKKEEEAVRLKKVIDEENRLKLQKEEEKRRREHEALLRKKKNNTPEIQIQTEESGENDASSVEDRTRLNSTTSGTSGYGIDIEDEVNFNTIYRAKSLYEYRGVREDDLSFNENEMIKAHPSKDKASDWWYGTSLSTNQVGFFPRTYVEVIEKAFRVRTVYSFRNTRNDDLGFSENEVIIVQPFQDEDSGWWYGTNEETKEAGYFPKTYVEVINEEPIASINSNTLPISIPLVNTPDAMESRNLECYGNSYLSIESHNARGLSAPNTPIMKKTALGATKAELTRRRRAASNVSTASNTHSISSPIVIPRSASISESLELTTWSSTIDELELQEIPLEERKRQEAIFELIATERTYLNDLQMIINVFYVDFGKYLTSDERDVVFSNIDDLMICNTALLSDMETRQREEANFVSKIGDIFLKHANSLKCYSSYCQNQSYASKFLQKKREEDNWLEVFLKTAQTRPDCRSLDFSHFLLEPVQRITRYPLLLRQILNSTPKRHPDYNLVKSALSVAQGILGDVNEETRKFENHQKMNELSRIIDMEGAQWLKLKNREYVMDGALFKAKSGRKLHGFLFNDVFLLAEPLKTLNEKGYLYTLYREPMMIEGVGIRQLQTVSLKQSFSSASEDTGFQIVYNNQVTAVKASSTSQKRQWLSHLQHYSSIKQYNA
ncbi:hypothetical protein BY458DRAFT_526897 [Sporodiniella umbellata]|nr:hypothetical protein BY458DRAFT_526897 [Sporodiniella umbellata]